MLREIGDSAFHSCYSLEEIVLPQGVNIIRNNMFANCFRMKKVVTRTATQSLGQELQTGSGTCSGRLWILTGYEFSRNDDERSKGWTALEGRTQFLHFVLNTERDLVQHAHSLLLLIREGSALVASDERVPSGFLRSGPTNRWGHGSPRRSLCLRHS